MIAIVENDDTLEIRCYPRKAKLNSNLGALEPELSGSTLVHLADVAMWRICSWPGGAKSEFTVKDQRHDLI